MQIVLIDDHHLFRAGLAAVLRKHMPAVQVLEADGAAMAWQILAASAAVKLLLLDLKLRDSNGLDMLPQLRLRYPALPVLVISASESPKTMQAALALGASGFLPKSANENELLQALQQALAGKVYVPHPEQIVRNQSKPAINFDSLTARQREVLALLAEGQSNRDIAQHLAICEGTVKQHLKAIFRVLRSTSRLQAMLAIRHLS